jgi:CubicO group peptidase (beta-lactamase class C family)
MGRVEALGAVSLIVAVSCGGHAGRPVTPAPVNAAMPARPPVSTPAPAKPTPATTRMVADTTLTTPSGASFEAPKDWFVTGAGDVIRLEDPERDLSLTLLEVTNAPNAETAIAASWQRVTPGFARKVKQITKPPAEDGWDELTQVVYETGGAELRTVAGIAHRKGTTNYIALFDSTDAGLDRRAAQAVTVVRTLKAPGVVEESLKDRTAHVLDAPRLALIEQFVKDAMLRASVPGAAMAIVRGGKVVFEKGFGVRELGKKAEVTPGTLFMIGSTTKSLTTLLMARLVDEGKFDWETPVTDVLPTFALADPDFTRKLLMRHTVCACTGLPRQDLELVFEYANATPEQRVESMKTMRPTTGLGETFQYSNTMVAAGGFVAAHALVPAKKLGPAYDAAMQSRVFGPLGMRSTTLDFAVASAREHAAPHARDMDLTYRVIPLMTEEGVAAIRPAGAAWSNVRDMERYLLLELANGHDARGRELVSAENLLRRRQPQIKITDKLSYGLGLFVEDDHGVRVVHHGGNNQGFTSDMYLLPEHDVGVVLLTNAGGANAFRTAMRRRILEVLFDAKEKAQRDLDYAIARDRTANDIVLGKVARDTDSIWMTSLVGTYADPALGVVTVQMEGTKGVFDAGEWKSAVGRKTETDGTVKLILLDPPQAGLELLPEALNGRRSLVLDYGQRKYVFEQVGTGSR